MAVDPFIRKKYEWLETVMHDGRLSPSARLVAYEIARHLNRVTGDAWPSQQTMARLLGLGLRTVERAVGELEGKNRNGTNGQSKIYMVSMIDRRSKSYIPCFDIIEIPAKMAGEIPAKNDTIPAKMADTPANMAGDTRQNVHQIPAKKGGLSLLSNSFREPDGRGGSVSAELRRIGSRFEEEADEGNGLTIEADPIGDAWPMVKAAVIGKHGERAKPYLDRLSARRDGHDIVHAAAGSFTVDTIRNDYLATLIDSWRAEYVWVRKVRLIVGTCEAAQ